MLAALTQRHSDEDQDPLLRLYWNRAGVKRELVSLKREHFELLEKLEQQEGAILRAQNQLEGLERLLTNPLAAANAMVYFQLRHLWRVAALKIEQFGRELKAQRENRERTQLHNTVLAKRNRRLEAIKLKQNELLQKRKRTIDECEQLEQRFEQMGFVVKFFAGRALKNRIQGETDNRAALQERINELEEATEKIRGEALPEPDGLSLESRRLINIAIIALAQHLVVHFSENELARLAKKASQRSVGDMKFGDRRICDRMVECIRERIDDLKNDNRLADDVKLRSDWLNNEIRYRHESDTAPMREDLAEIPRSVGDDSQEQQERGESDRIRINVLEDDYWDLNEVLG